VPVGVRPLTAPHTPPMRPRRVPWVSSRKSPPRAAALVPEAVVGGHGMQRHPTGAEGDALFAAGTRPRVPQLLGAVLTGLSCRGPARGQVRRRATTAMAAATPVAARTRANGPRGLVIRSAILMSGAKRARNLSRPSRFETAPRARVKAVPRSGPRRNQKRAARSAPACTPWCSPTKPVQHVL